MMAICNAYTSDQCTVYMFSINSDAYNEALDRFAHFFIDPSLTSSGLDREQHAVDQEFARSFENDDWRTEMVLKELGNPNHPNSQFSCGNVQTLHGITSEDSNNGLKPTIAPT